jgi:putative Ca2+/H+ antiporter (TMEM165/GDT1 family)
MFQREPAIVTIEPAGELAPSPSTTALETTETPAIGAIDQELPSRFQDVASCFLSTFVTIFLAELGDKTQIATLLMSAQSHKPTIVFFGAATALIATSLVGVLLGRWLSRILTPRTLERLTGGILAVVSILLFIDVAGA